MQPLLRVGVVADTHIPDRARTLHPDLLPALRTAGISQILHAGDISTPGVIEELAQIAPVSAVRGNRDWSLRGKAGLVLHLDLAGVPVALMHGHISWFRYLFDKFRYMSEGYRLERYIPFLLKAADNDRVIVFGHTHHTENLWHDGKMLFNPGSASFGTRLNRSPSWGLLSIFGDGRVEGEIFRLNGYHLENSEWLPGSYKNS